MIRLWKRLKCLFGFHEVLCWNCNCAIGIKGYCPHDKT